MTDNDILQHSAQLLEQFARKDCERARTKMTSAPLTLTDADFVTLHNHGDDGEASRAWEARRLAQLALVTPAPAPLQTKAITTHAAPPATMDEFLQRCGDKPATYTALTGLQDDVMALLRNHKEKLDALTQANKALSDRVLELEAHHAATSKVDV